jgi:hypothetical protein
MKFHTCAEWLLRCPSNYMPSCRARVAWWLSGVLFPPPAPFVQALRSPIQPCILHSPSIANGHVKGGNGRQAELCPGPWWCDSSRFYPAFRSFFPPDSRWAHSSPNSPPFPGPDSFLYSHMESPHSNPTRAHLYLATVTLSQFPYCSFPFLFSNHITSMKLLPSSSEGYSHFLPVLPAIISLMGCQGHASCALAFRFSSQSLCPLDSDCHPQFCSDQATSNFYIYHQSALL